MTTQSATRRRWFRFSLRTLLIVVALAAVASWAFWIGWPWWVIYREQVRFERDARQLKIGSTSHDAHELLKWHYVSIVRNYVSDDKIIQIRHYELSKADYLIYSVIPTKSWDSYKLERSPCSSVEVFRLPHAPPDYRAVRQRVIEDLQQVVGTRSDTILDSPGSLYVRDLSDFLIGDRKNNPGFQYELIYSDPPQNDKPK